MSQAYPLQWPDGWERTQSHKRQSGDRFKRGHWQGGHKRPTIATTREELSDELRLLGARNVVLSTNVELRLDGLPYSNRRPPEDPGIAVYFTLEGESMVMAQDMFDRVPDNIRSLTLAIAGMRQMKRHGGGTMLKRAFQGFTALPGPDEVTRASNSAWWVVLDCSSNATREEAHHAFKAMVREAGGATVELNNAWAEARAALGKE